MLVMEKSRDIAILKTMGAGARWCAASSCSRARIIGLAGTTAGAVAGFVICTVMDRYRLLRLPMDVYQVTYVPFIIEPLDFWVVLLTANVVLPAGDAASIRPRGPDRPGRGVALRVAVAPRSVAMPFLVIEGLSKSYRMGDRELPVLRDLDWRSKPERWSRSSGRRASARAPCCTFSAASTVPGSDAFAPVTWN